MNLLQENPTITMWYVWKPVISWSIEVKCKKFSLTIIPIRKKFWSRNFVFTCSKL